jgi:drug/metabolite transporter (DMT)-like permease
VRARFSSSDPIWVLFFLLAFAWGAGYLFIRVALEHGLLPLPLVAIRLCIGAVLLWIIAFARHENLRLERRHAVLLPLIATINIAVPFFLVAWGERTVSSGLASVLNSTVPIFSVLLAGAVLHDEPITGMRLGGVAAGFVGIIVLFSPDITGGNHWSHLAGQGSILLSSILYAVGAVLTRRLLRGLPALTIATYSVTTAAVETGVVSLLLSPPTLGSLGAEGWLAVLWLAVMGVALAYLLAFTILAEWGAARYSLVAYTLPVIGLTLGAIFLHETLDARVLGGSALVLAGIVLSSLMRTQAKAKDDPLAA